MDLVEVIWRGPFDCDLVNGQTVRRGDRLPFKITREQAASGHYEIIEPAAKRAHSAGNQTTSTLPDTDRSAD